jgi:hypothetical protein
MSSQTGLNVPSYNHTKFQSAAEPIMNVPPIFRGSGHGTLMRQKLNGKFKTYFKIMFSSVNNPDQALFGRTMPASHNSITHKS